MLTAMNDKGGVVIADEAEKGKYFSCPECNSKVILKKGTIKIDHFAHSIKNESCGLGRETREHLFGKFKIYNLLKMSGWDRVQLEKSFTEINRRSDVYAETVNTKDNNEVVRIVFEIQNSSMSVDEVEERTQDYNSIGIRVVWIPVFKSLDVSSDESLFSTNIKDVYLTCDIKLTDWQVLMCGYHQNKVLGVVKDGQNLNLILLHMSRATRPGSEWYDEYGELQSSSGYTLANTYEANVFFVDDNLLNVHEMNRYMKNDYKKNWDLTVFGNFALAPKIEKSFGIFCDFPPPSKTQK